MTHIEWTDETWNPTTGCNKVSPGCKNCYAEVMHKRLMAMFPKKYSNKFLEGVQTHDDELTKPLRWKKPRKIFVNSMSDLFHEDVPFEFIDKVFAVMGITSQHTYQILTKRPERMLEYFNRASSGYDISMKWDDEADDLLHPDYAWHGEMEFPLPNVWLGTSCENQQTADERIPFLLQTPAAVRFLSCEPLLGAIDLTLLGFHDSQKCGCENHSDYCPYNPHKIWNKVDWVICGGESGPKARPMHPDWARSLRDQCKAAGVPFFFKQWGEWAPGDQRIMRCDELTINTAQHRWESGQKWSYKIGKHAAGRLLDGMDHNEFPQGIASQSLAMTEK